MENNILRFLKSYESYITESYYGDIKKWYRGESDNAFKKPWIWITDNIDHAKEYGDIVTEYSFDYALYENRIAYAEIKELLKEYTETYKREGEYLYEPMWNPTIEFVDFLKSKNYVGYHFEAEGGSRLCILYRDLVKNPKKVI